jgi:hypothetical protein
LLAKKRNPLFLKKTHKFGIEVPKTVKDVLEIDRRNGNTFWADAIAKEMKDVRVTSKSYSTGSLRLLAIKKYLAI